ncbi:hypothetical protein [Pseudoalteromonas umbrosa]|uniref:hypothetical protein n=1 Tax=Pseudoalteromonas umbrosa TaxID=3048489 RepID=UPI0024C44F19|nr:hypothetical protein [Pseudoalteromonas sp. B95]MDK1288835.1 hypothetical protein [Pseudoalteromonas sp. B95]
MKSNNAYFEDENSFSQRECELIRRAYYQGYLRGKEDGVNGVHMSSRIIENNALAESFGG